MSHYATVEMEFKFEKELILALEAVYGRGNISVYSEAQHLYGYQGDRRSQKANIIIRRKHVGRLANDIGFLKTETGYRMIISDYDSSANNKTKEIVSEYATRVMKNRLPRGKYRMKEQTGNKFVLQVR